MNIQPLLALQAKRDDQDGRTPKNWQNSRVTLLVLELLGQVIANTGKSRYWEDTAPLRRKGVGGTIWDVMECDLHTYKDPLLESLVNLFSAVLTLGNTIHTAVDEVSELSGFDETEALMHVTFCLGSPVGESLYKVLVEDFLALCDAFGYSKETLLDAYQNGSHVWMEKGFGENLPRLTQTQIAEIRAAHPLPSREEYV